MYKILVLKETGGMCLIKDWECNEGGIAFTVLHDKFRKEAVGRQHFFTERELKEKYEVPMTIPILLNDSIPGDLYMYDLRYSNTTEPILYRVLMVGNTVISLHDVNYDIRNLEHEVIDPYDSLQGIPLLTIDAWSMESNYINFDDFDKVYGTIKPAASVGNSYIDNASINTFSFNFKSDNSTL